jgi:hypothetical protein
MTHLQPSQPPRAEARLTPAEHAAEMRARADDAADDTARAYWLWLADEWDKTMDRQRRRPPPRSWADE